MKRIASSGIGIALLLGALGLCAGAQNQAPNQAPSNPQSSSSDSLGDYARQVRKAPPAPAKPKVFDNDNLPRDEKLSIVGNAAEPGAPSTETKPEEAAASAQSPIAPTKAQTEAGQPATGQPATSQPAPAATAPARSPEEEEAAKQALWKQWEGRIAGQKEQIDLLSRELDVLQREYKLRAAAMYADAGNRMRNSGDWDKQDAQYKQQIADKQKALDDAKQKLDDMLEEARKVGVPSSIAEP